MDKKKSRSISQNNAEERRVLELQDAFAPAFSSFSSMMNFAASYLHVNVFRLGARLEDVLRVMQEVSLNNFSQDAGATPNGALPKAGPQRAETIDSGARPGLKRTTGPARLEATEVVAWRLTPFRFSFARSLPL